MIQTYIVDAFTSTAFKGNPAGVCVLNTPISETTMHAIAKELGFSETAFVCPLSNSTERYTIRFFSPKMEIPLCGHATLAASKVIFSLHKSLTTLTFKTFSGLELSVEMHNGLIKMVFPIYNTVPQSAPKLLLSALGITEITNSRYNNETKILLLEIDDSDVLQLLQPNFEQLKAAHTGINGVLVTAVSKQKHFDFESRYFWPWSGTNEDPVTGGTHTFLAKYWSLKLRKKRLKSYQCSERTGQMIVEIRNETQMTIEGEACIVLKGDFLL
jgi:PhzF family phenazine biosynthesis protein